MHPPSREGLLSLAILSNCQWARRWMGGKWECWGIALTWEYTWNPVQDWAEKTGKDPGSGWVCLNKEDWT